LEAPFFFFHARGKENSMIKTRSESLTVIKLQMVREKIGYYGTKKVRSPADVEEVVRAFIGQADREIFLALNLSSANNINSIHVVSIGTLNQSIIHPRECFKAALLSNADAVIFAHNHPSGEVEPSAEDKQITTRLKECGQLLNIRVLDHVIVGENVHFSFQESGLL
jgi:DNA repair protein RadC